MAVEVFIEDDEAYLSWRSSHPGGFVANLSAKGKSFVMLHRVSHKLSSRGSTHPNRFTHTDIKRVSDDLPPLVTAVVKAGYTPQVFRNCKICQLGTGGRFEPTLDHQLLNEATFELLTSSTKPDCPKGYTKPKVALRDAQEYYRCPQVRAWVLWQAQGKCEGCKQHAPFTDSRGIRYLEVHHIVSLSAGGSDVVENCVAICPNCHREAHLGRRAPQLTTHLKKAIKLRIFSSRVLR